MNNCLDLRVARIACETESILSFCLAHPAGGELPPFTAGAHVDVLTPAGVTRQYSLCNEPGDTSHYQIAVLNEPRSRGGSRSMHDDVRVGTTLTVSVPRNHFPLVPTAHAILLAGGIGITPLLAMAEHLSSSGQSFELHYCARSQGNAAFLERIRQSRFKDSVHWHFDDAAPAGFDCASVLGAPGRDKHLFVCGPSGFIDFARQTARKAGWAETCIHHEHFGASPAASSGDQFEVVVASTGKTYRIPEGRSVAQVLNREGVHIPVSCEQGVCGTCLTRVLEGVPDHRDLFLTDQERDGNAAFLPCCSRAKSAVLVLDL
jgi:vanillate O-demethylase ferredoxin subunit